MMKSSNMDVYGEFERMNIQQLQSNSVKVEDMKKLNNLEDGELSESNAERKEPLISLLDELILNVNEAAPVIKAESNTLQHNAYEKFHPSEFETVEKENKEELNNLEEGEISDNDKTKENKKNVCHYFKQGSCFRGSHCQLLHISDKVYNMFDPLVYNIQSQKPLVSYFSPEIRNPLQLVQDNENAWERGLKNAKAMIQRANFKRMNDKEFENKKLYLCSSNLKCDISQEKDLTSKTLKRELNLSSNTYPCQAHSLRLANDRNVMEKKSINASRCFYVEKSSCDYKWVDPWMRSKSPRKKCKSHVTSSQCSRKDFYRERSSSSSSSIECICQGSEDNKLCKKRPLTSQFIIKHSRNRSYSRSCSRKRCRSHSSSGSKCCSRKRCQSHSSSGSESSTSLDSHCSKSIKKPLFNKPSKRNFKKKRCTSLEKWYKCQHRIASISCSSSRSSIFSVPKSTRNISSKCNSDSENWSSSTDSSETRSSSSVSHSSHLKVSTKNDLSKTDSFVSTNNATKTSNLHHERTKESPSSNKFVKNKASKENISSFYMDKTSGKVSQPLVTRIPLSRVVTKVAALSPVKPVVSGSTVPSKSFPNRKTSKDHLSSALNCLLRYQSISKGNVSNSLDSKPINSVTNLVFSSQASKSKVNNLQVPSLQIFKKKVVNSTNVPSLASQSKVIPSFQASKTTVINSSLEPVVKGTFSNVSKRTITLNLQPKLKKHLKVSEFLHKKQGIMCNFEESRLNKKESLLKKLKLIEDAIAKKKQI